jgi:hypothetical protein
MTRRSTENVFEGKKKYGLFTYDFVLHDKKDKEQSDI